MAAQLLQQVSPSPVKLEYSPAESWVSIPGDPYPSLFATTPGASDCTINPLDVLTPRSESRSASEERQARGLSAIPEEAQTPAPGSEKKPAKKRKSWGQVLPEPKTNLPPRKRAKTEDEKEQRRVERVLRNRRAAQSSRERKRLEVEALEKENQDLKAKVAMLENNQRALTEELTRLRKEFGVVTPSTSPLRMIPVTLSQELFSSQDAQASVTSNPLPEPTLSTSKTINPASLSPELRPVPDFTAQKQAKQPKQPKTTEPSESTLVPSPDVTQRPAVSHIGGDAPVVPSLANLDSASLGLAAAAPEDAAFSLGDSFTLDFSNGESGNSRFETELGLLTSPATSLDDEFMASDSSFDFSHTSDFDLFDEYTIDVSSSASSEHVSARDNAAADYSSFDCEVFDFKN